MQQPTVILDAKGLACPMPIVKTKKQMNELLPGDVLEVQATDKGSTADLAAWSKSAGHEFLGTRVEGQVLHHLIRKGGAQEEEGEPMISEISLNAFQQKVKEDQSLFILDVRELDEYEAGHIPGAVHIPLGEVEHRAEELTRESVIYLICHSGRRSELAAQKLKEKGFQQLINVVPGMNSWTGAIEK
ncbi:sulfurtransferase TusA family protein [Bacillus safensis]|uniref:sulfurtransferase TusA family protein n=1 Tax=Bacillus safensis TaxID=561879 RepID=UPI002B250608|nr:sulfurtransferase TusA family protein [Bacillus safensis]MEB2271702.1 sulfurtransferase TusA family protein [Bacillus safensis]